MKDRFKYLFQSLLMPLFAILLFLVVYLVQVSTLQSMKSSFWISVGDSAAKRISQQIVKSLPNAILEASVGISDVPPASCARSAYLVTTFGGADENEKALAVVLSAGPEVASVCSGTMFESIPHSEGSAYDWKITALYLAASLIFIAIFLASKRWLPPNNRAENYWAVVGWTLACAVIVVAANIVIFTLWSSPLDSAVADNQSFGQSSIFYLILTIAVAPLVEEAAYRAWLIPTASKGISQNGAVALSAVLFSVYHLPANGHEWAFYFFAGISLSLLWVRTRSLLACVIAHATVNAFTFIT